MLRKIKEFVQKRIELVAENEAMNISTALLHQQTFKPFKNFCYDKEVVICGAGPSLKNYKPIEGAVHIALNRSFLLENVKFDFIFAQDMDGIRMVQNELIEYRKGECIKLFGTQMGTEKEIPESLAIKCGALRFNTDLYIYKDGFKSKFICDIDSRALGNMPNVGMSVMQFALYMNPKRIYIVGCDMSGTHFEKNHQTDFELSAEKKQYDSYWEMEQKRLIDKWAEIKQNATIYYPDTEIISVNPVGLKGMFRDIYQ